MVLINPGLIVFTRMCCGPSSQAILRAICSTPDFDEWYATEERCGYVITETY